ncbi:general secretion pathway protein GspB [Desulfocastanea catecholica]
MSYILDALKKSDQERQQGSSPNVHSTHGPIIAQRRGSASIFKQRPFLLVSGGIVLFCAFLGIFFFQQHRFLSEQDSTKTPAAALLSTVPQTATTAPLPQPSSGGTEANTTSAQTVVVIEKNNVALSTTGDKKTLDPPTSSAAKAAQTSVSLLPLLEDLPAALQAEIPPLKFAGHTYSKKPSQRIIIINGKILREGDMIAPSTFLKEITWEGVTIESNSVRFRVKTN